jgi:hypothetical protein
MGRFDLMGKARAFQNGWQYYRGEIMANVSLLIDYL